MTETRTPCTDTLHAWAEIQRTELPKRSVSQRVADFLEIYTTLDEETAREQAMRCVQCPHPACVEACPLGNRIPDWLALTAEGQFVEAAQLLQSSSCMGDLFSRLCADPCESRCVVDGPGQPVSINAIERFLQSYGSSHGVSEDGAPTPNGYKVAVLDAGPCGLACAQELALNGYAVTIFDHHAVPGGLLINGTPAFKVDKHIVEHRLEYLRGLSVEFRLGDACDADLSLATLREKFDAVFFGACAEEARPLRVPGADLRGVYQGVTFLLQQNSVPGIRFAPIEVAGRRVVVLGAGETAMDCLRVALRSHASSVICVYRKGEAEVSSAHPAYVEACEEGAEFEFFAQPVAVEGGEAGEVIAVRCAKTVYAKTGGTEPGGGEQEVETLSGPEFLVPADVVLVAYGYEAAPFCPAGDLQQIRVDGEGRILVDNNMMTSVPGVYAGGSLVHGRMLPVETVRDARRAARAIHRHLVGVKGAKEG
ncbi:MAG: FAD-dependent oxidoreductase [Verrucomicrobiales bacterium]|nr:FAD-dependent oxidoreductase [Verrucomicrobiales bacterium]